VYGRVKWGVPAGGTTVRSTGGTARSAGGRDQCGPGLCGWDPLCHDVGARAARSFRGTRRVLLPADRTADQAYDGGDGPRPVRRRSARHSTATAATEASTHSGTPHRTEPDGAHRRAGQPSSQRSAVWRGKLGVEEGHPSVSGCPSCHCAPRNGLRLGEWAGRHGYPPTLQVACWNCKVKLWAAGTPRVTIRLAATV
jgi:hypothetical protein